MEDTLEVSILGYGKSSKVVTIARHGSDLATASFNCSKMLRKLNDFRKRIEQAILNAQDRPTPEELYEYGKDLFLFTIPQPLKTLYDRLPSSPMHVRMHVFTNRPEFQAIPWEYLQEPNHKPGPRHERSVVRIVPTVGVETPPPKLLTSQSSKVKVLFVAAEPRDQNPVSWPNVRDSIERTFRLSMPEQFDLKVIPGVSAKAFTSETGFGGYDIVHFSGHGEVIGGVGNLLFVDPITKKSERLRADQLGTILTGLGIRLVVLSACESSAGNFEQPFSTIAGTLVSEGLPAVVGNQFPAQDEMVASFVGPLYSQLLKTGDIDQAVSFGRVNLFAQLSPPKAAVLEWGIPTLHRHINASQLFEV
jgi:hypothetical protein